MNLLMIFKYEHILKTINWGYLLKNIFYRIFIGHLLGVIYLSILVYKSYICA